MSVRPRFMPVTKSPPLAGITSVGRVLNSGLSPREGSKLKVRPGCTIRSKYCFSLYGMPKFHIGVEISTRSPSASLITIRSMTANASRCGSLKGRPAVRAYLASSAAPSNSGRLSRQRSSVSKSQPVWVSRKRARNASVPALDAESRRGEAKMWNSFDKRPGLLVAGRSAERRDDRVSVRDDRNVLQREVDRGVVPVGVHRRTAILRHYHEITLVGAGSGGVFDRHVGPGAGVDDHVALAALQQRLELCALPGAHPYLLDDQIAGMRLQSRHGRRAPAAAHHRLVVDDALEQRRVQRHAGSARLDHEPDMNDHHAARAPRRRGGARSRRRVANARGRA